MKIYACHGCRRPLLRKLGPGLLPLVRVACNACGQENFLGGTEERGLLGLRERAAPAPRDGRVRCHDCGRVIAWRPGGNWRIVCPRCRHPNVFLGDAKKALDAATVPV